MNLVETILKQLTGDQLGQFASLLGESPVDTQKAIQATVPTLLAGVGNLASKPEGAEKLWSTLKQLDREVVDDYGSVLQGGRVDDLAKSGSSILDGLFGKGMMAAVIAVLAKFLGGKSGLVTKLLPMLTPIILGMIQRQVRSGGLDLGGLVKILLGQKGNIAGAMPAGLARQLAGTEGLAGLADFLPESPNVASPSNRPTTAAKSSSSPAGWLLPLLLLVGLLAIGYWVMTRNKADVAPVPSDMGALAQMADATSVTEKFSELFDNLGETISGIDGVDAARSALPQLEAASLSIDELAPLMNQLPAAARGEVAQLVTSSQDALQQKTDTLFGIPGLGDILRPALDQIFAKLTALVEG